MEQEGSQNQTKNHGLKTEHGRIYAINGRLYLKWYYKGSNGKGKDFIRSLDANESQLSIAKRNAPKTRKDAEREYEEKLKAEQANPIPEVPKVVAKIWDKGASQSYLDYFYKPGLSSLNTRYDTLKILNLYFGHLGKYLNKPLEEITFPDISTHNLKEAWDSLKLSKGKDGISRISDKVLQKVHVALHKFIDHHISKKNLSKEDYLKDIKPPKTANIIRLRKKKLKDEIWSKEDFTTVIEAMKAKKACKECEKGFCESKVHRQIRPLDYEIYWIMRYMGIPPSDIYQLESSDFKLDEDKELVLAKERAKNSEDKFFEYYQPIDKGLPEDKESLRIIQERIREVGKSGRLFVQGNIVNRARNDSQDDRTRWVSNLSGRRIELQKALGMNPKPVKGLRTTFLDFWYSKSVPLDILRRWAGHSDSSAMILNLYSETESTPKFKLA